MLIKTLRLTDDPVVTCGSSKSVTEASLPGMNISDS